MLQSAEKPEIQADRISGFFGFKIFSTCCFNLQKILRIYIQRNKIVVFRSVTHNISSHFIALYIFYIFRYYYVNEETWLNMGYTMEEVPQSFSEFIDFLTLWCERIEEEPEANTVAMGGWDSESYSAGAYIARLAEILVNEVIMQQQYAEQELSFNTSEIVELLEKCIDVGTRLYKLESKNYSATLFEQIAGGIWPSKYSTIVFF